MATTTGSHSVAAFTSPVNGTSPIDANTVKANDNTLRVAYVNHDADTGIHVQSSDLASRPAAGVAGRKWMTVDAGVVRLWYDTGVAWVESGVVGPSSATDNTIVRFDGTTGKLVQNSTVTVSDLGAIRTAATSFSGTAPIAIEFTGTLTSGSHTLVTGIQSRLSNQRASGSSSTCVAVVARIDSDSVTADTTYGVDVTNSNNGATSLTLAVGIQVRSMLGPATNKYCIQVDGTSGTVSGTAYGLRIGNITGGATNYSIDTGTGIVRFGDVVNINTASGLQVQGTKVVGARGSAVTAPTGGATVDAEARTAINTIISRLQAHGLIA